MKYAIGVLVLFLGARVAYGQSELRFASHLEIHGVGATASGAATAVSMADTVTVVSERGTRTESHQTVPAISGSIVIQRADGTFVLEEREKTYFKTPAFSGSASAPAKTETTYSRTGEFAMIAGIRAERVSFKIETEIPTATGAQATVETTGDLWLTDAFSDYKIAGIGQLGAATRPRGFPLRSVLRGGIIGPNEVDVTVTSVAEEPFQPELFDPPPDYKERPIPRN